eukprot:104581-Prymnesium_polylepis.1
MIVKSRCAIASTVNDANSERSNTWIASSVASSRLDVASSRMSTRAWPSIARAKQSSCRSPEERLVPPFESCLVSRASSRCARRSTSLSLASGSAPNGS